MATAATIRLATLEDVPTILALIHELAAYENETSSVLATEESLARTLSFAPSRTRRQSGPLSCPHHKHDCKEFHEDSAPRLPTHEGFAKTLLLTAPEGEVAGMALYFHNYSTWRAAPGIYLEDLFVKPKYRKRGYGKALIRELAQEVVKINGGRLEWSCLNWNKPSLEFYEALGAKRMVEWVGLRVDGDALTKLAQGEEREV
ncbi:GCN5-related N-acetyltransferas-like protein [Mytilinidion resinicola]|uniref:GCN5-related N-acetyltransferas-like protein n=1 Tax=Mytilinidion resinicola TaxID=574789 RepID=A0A6A6ZB63_9PEZI|nr:GCN5-related N-acetyltransferas-like protein [Mytilinidion resinicola]KAF2817544.1 GCN5-related N-acetyltransferas-like protein [Mytilinidion resinicola]